MTFAYLCEEGKHFIESPRPLESCPGLYRGVPCKGELRRVGKGSRKAERAHGKA